MSRSSCDFCQHGSKGCRWSWSGPWWRRFYYQGAMAFMSASEHQGHDKSMRQDMASILKSVDDQPARGLGATAAWACTRMCLTASLTPSVRVSLLIEES
eukprot:6484829-Prymnesium_polylepis.1